MTVADEPDPDDPAGEPDGPERGPSTREAVATGPRSLPADMTRREATLVGLDEFAGELLSQSWSEATLRAYRSDCRIFVAWCRALELDPLPASPRTVARFIAAQSVPSAGRPGGFAPATLARRLAAIRHAHAAAGHASPTDAPEITQMLRGHRKAWRRPPDKKDPLLDEPVCRASDLIDSSTRRGLRDRALLLLGFAGAFRRSELVAIDVEHLVARREGLLVRIPRSKTDQAGDGQSVAILHRGDSPYCPVRAIAAWRNAGEIDEGALFRRFYKGDVVSPHRLSGEGVGRVVKSCAEHLELDAAKFAGHSLRRGFITEAAENGEDLFKIASQSRHRDVRTVMTYRDDIERFRNHAGQRMLRRENDPEDDR